MTVTRVSKIGGVLKSTGNSTHDAFKLTRHASFSCEVISSRPLLLPRRDVADVGTTLIMYHTLEMILRSQSEVGLL